MSIQTASLPGALAHRISGGPAVPRQPATVVQAEAGASDHLINGLDSGALLQCFLEHPPVDVVVLGSAPIPVFSARFDLLTAADDALKSWVRGLPWYARWADWLRPRVAFAGCSVTEYSPLPTSLDARPYVRRLRSEVGSRHALTVVKDLPNQSPLLAPGDNALADVLAAACQEEGFIVVEGLPLAYVPIDFSDVHTYIDRLPKASRRYITRRLRTREQICVVRLSTGTAFADDAKIATYYSLYQEVYRRSDTKLDCLTEDFFASVLRDEFNNGVVFEYRHAATGDLLGWNLCFEIGGRLIDKYIGLSYPACREMNLYFVSWVVNLEYALTRGLSHYVAGASATDVKVMLGARFTPTRHAVYVRNPLLRMLARRFAGRFSMGDH